MPLYVGVDLHRDYSMVTVLGMRGKPLQQLRVRNDNLGDFLASLREKPSVVLEATRNWSYPVELMEPHARQIVLAHPKKTKAIAPARIKTDKLDSACLARLLRSDLVPAAYIPPQEIRDLRDLLRHRAGLVRLRTQVKNKVHTVLSRYGLTPPFSDVFGVAGTRWLRALSTLRPVHREMLNRYLRLVDNLDAEIDPLGREIEQLVADDSQAQLLCTIPGIGRYSSLLILAEIGEPGRFPDAKHWPPMLDWCRRCVRQAGTFASVASRMKARRGCDGFRCRPCPELSKHRLVWLPSIRGSAAAAADQKQRWLSLGNSW